MRSCAKWIVAASLSLIGLALYAQRLDVYYFPRPPLYTANADGSAGGFLNEIAKLVLDEAKIPYRLVEIPSARVELAVKNREYAAGLGWFKNPEREQWANFSAPIYQDRPLVAVVNKAKAGPFGAEARIDQLLGTGLTLGTIRGFSYGSFADGAIERLHPSIESIVGPQSSLIQMVARGRADLLLLGMEEAGYLMEHDPNMAASLKIVRISDAPAGSLRYFMFSKSVDSSVIERIDAAIEKIKGGAAYRKLIDFSGYLD
ncbi:MAG TPA: transporter substrate-binding domain-containing protein [Rectinemataceae bacterium]|nr:transporter substrate-binding domain-containing protein [Rectinemataceae bacterium]